MPVVNLTGGPVNQAVVVWNNYAARSSTDISSGSADPLHPAINTIDPATYSYWRSSSLSGSWVRYTFSGPLRVDSIGISAHNLASSGASITISGTVNGTSYAIIATYSPLTDEDIIFLVPPVNYRGVRITVTGSIANIGVVFIGRSLRFPCAPIDSYTPTHHAKRYDKVFTRSLRGHFLGNRVMGAGGRTEVSFPMLERDFVDGPLVGFEDHYNRGGTFFYAGWPSGKPQDMAYARAPAVDSVVDVTYVSADRLAELSFGMETYVSE